jgi:hypothetical protein
LIARDHRPMLALGVAMESGVAEQLFQLVVGMARSAKLDREMLEWGDLSPDLRSKLDSTMNDGIPREKAEYHQVAFTDHLLTVSFYRDEKLDFWGIYLLDHTEVLYSSENWTAHSSTTGIPAARS